MVRTGLHNQGWFNTPKYYYSVLSERRSWPIGVQLVSYMIISLDFSKQSLHQNADRQLISVGLSWTKGTLCYSP